MNEGRAKICNSCSDVLDRFKIDWWSNPPQKVLNDTRFWRCKLVSWPQNYITNAAFQVPKKCPYLLEHAVV